jgi:hypothetical protein
MNKFRWAVLALWLLAVPLHAQDTPRGDVSVQYSPLYVLKGYTIWMNGVSASVERNVTNWLGFAGDLGVYRGHVPENLTGETSWSVHDLLPAKSRSSFHWPRSSFSRVCLADRIFLGPREASRAGEASSHLPWAGADVGLGRTQRFALRPKLEYVGIRSGDSTTSSVRLSIGMVYRIGRH